MRPPRRTAVMIRALSSPLMIRGAPITRGERMSLVQTAEGYGLAPGEGEPLWFNGGFGVLKATGVQTDGRFAAMELVAPKGVASPLHIHRAEDELFVVLSGEARVQHGSDVMEAVAGSLGHGPRHRAHALR